MSTAAVDLTSVTAPANGRRKLLLLAVPLLLGVAGAGLWFGGVLPPLLGLGRDQHGGPARAEVGHPAGGPELEPGHDTPVAPGGGKVRVPLFVDVPEIIANLNAGSRRTSFVKLHAKLEIARPEDQAVVTAAMPRLLDLFQTYLREMRPEELRGSAGTYRLREELIARAGLAASPAQIVDVLFTEMLVQ